VGLVREGRVRRRAGRKLWVPYRERERESRGGDIGRICAWYEFWGGTISKKGGGGGK